MGSGFVHRPLIRESEHMRYDKEHKQETRSRIVKAASARFRNEGIEAVGVASLMASAGLTHGGFYAHFASKEALIAEACAEGLSETVAQFREQVQAAPAGKRFKRLVNLYLSERHRDEPAQGCVIASLGPEIARHTMESRKPFTVKVDALLELMEGALRDDGADPTLATGMLGTLVGSLTLARAVDDPEKSRQHLAAGRQAVLTLAEQSQR